jgi:hypothetical protein
LQAFGPALPARRRGPRPRTSVESLEVLEAALDAWPGALVVATHDRVFRERLRVNREVGL